MRCPRPHKGAVRNWSPPAPPWETLSANPAAIWWISRSVYALTVTFPSEEVICEGCVFMFDAWQTAQPTDVNNDLPLLMEVVPPGVVVEATGGASSRMNCAKPSTSLRI